MLGGFLGVVEDSVACVVVFTRCTGFIARFVFPRPGILLGVRLLLAFRDGTYRSLLAIVMGFETTYVLALLR